MGDVRWPGDASDPAAKDLSQPLQELLQGLQVLEKPDDKVTLTKTPASLQVITSGATALAKVYAGLVASGGIAAAGTAALGFWRGLEGSASDIALQRVAIVGAVALFGSAVVVAIALIVRGDVLGRAQASAAGYDARARIAVAFLDAARARPAPEARYAVKTADGLRRVREFRWEGATAVAVVDGDKLPSREWVDLVSLDDRADGTP